MSRFRGNGIFSGAQPRPSKLGERHRQNEQALLPAAPLRSDFRRSPGGDIKSGAAVAIISSLVGLPISLLMDYINTLFPDSSRYQQAFNKYKVSLEILFNHEQELDNIRQDRRKSDASLSFSDKVSEG